MTKGNAAIVPRITNTKIITKCPLGIFCYQYGDGNSLFTQFWAWYYFFYCLHVAARMSLIPSSWCSTEVDNSYLKHYNDAVTF